jgi:hypothetical protein
VLYSYLLLSFIEAVLFLSIGEFLPVFLSSHANLPSYATLEIELYSELNDARVIASRDDTPEIAGSNDRASVRVNTPSR